MSQEQWRRLDAVQRWQRGELTQAEVAKGLGLSVRQVRRIIVAIGRQGTAALQHGNQGREPWNKTSAAVRSRLEQLAREVYVGFNDHHYTELLSEREGIEIGRSTVRRVLRAAGIAAVQQRRSPKVHRRRERKSQEGLMLLWDGSKHDWLEGRGPSLCLMAAMDDATGKLLAGAHFREEENAAGYLSVLLNIAQTHGLPWSIYGDRHSALHRNDTFWRTEEVKTGEREATQVGQALQELGIESIRALTPQAKGRVERLWRTLQDRLVSELRLANARTIADANALLRRFIPRFNERFAVTPKKARPAWRKHEGTDLSRACCFRARATVSPAHTVQFQGMTIDLDIPPQSQSLKGKQVLIRLQLDGKLRVEHGELLLAQQLIAPPVKAPRRQVREEKKDSTYAPRVRAKKKKSFKQVLAQIRAQKKAA